MSTFDLWVIAGEWTAAATDCGVYKLPARATQVGTLIFIYSAKYLNGRGVGARYDGSMSGSTKVGSCTGRTGKASTFSSSYKTFLRQYWEAQVIAYEHGQGWMFWVCAPPLFFN